MPAEIIKLLVILVLIIFFLKVRLNLGLNLLLNSVLMGVLFRIEILQIFHIWKNAALDSVTLELVGIIFLVYLLSIIMEKLKKFEGMVFSLQKMIKDYRLVMILISSFVALLPIQGGAIFSAPMIKSIGETNHLSSEKNMFINYWFRHIWNLVWPLYPSIILYSSLIGISLVRLVITVLPFAVISFLSGIIWVYRNSSNYTSFPQNNDNKKTTIILIDFIKDIWPVLVVILLVLLFNISLLLSLFIVIIAIFIFYPEIRSQLISLFVKSISRSYKTIFMIFGIFIFKEMLEYSQIVEFLPNYFLSLGIPINGILILVPFFIGVFTGSQIAYIGICVPVFFAFLVDANGIIIVSRIIILYIAGYIGTMLTPIHLCLAITKDYFQAKISSFYYILVIHLSILGIFSLVYYLFLVNMVD